jgi:hypothetical protein
MAGQQLTLRHFKTIAAGHWIQGRPLVAHIYYCPVSPGLAGSNFRFFPHTLTQTTKLSLIDFVTEWCPSPQPL